MSRLVGLVLTVVVLTAAPGGAPVSAQGSTRTELVCVGMGGDGLSLVRWTEDEIAAWEARTGGGVTRAHPETGTCEDPSGLPLLRNASQSFTYLCLSATDGTWSGPVWIANIYRSGREVPLDPVTGRCPTPRAAPPPPPTAEREAAATAVYLSQLEAAGDYDTLYAWLHPDAKAIIPKAAVVGWYTHEWAPRGGEPITVERVHFVDWTWHVTGERYGTTAEVAFRQHFADGTEAEDVVRLVQDERGVWRWFFGRDRAFVDAQITAYGDDSTR